MNQFASYFIANRANFAQRLLWEHTIYQVIRLFEEAERRIRSGSGENRYRNLDGWWRRASQRINGKNGFKVPEETAVSEALIEQMEAAKLDFMLDSLNCEPDMADIDSLEFAAEVPRRQKTGIGRRAKPTDFRFYRSGIGNFDLRIEAKVITKETEIAGHYLSKSGLGRFSDPDEPYTDDIVGGMVAYTVSEDRTKWLAKIDERMSSGKPPIYSFRHKLPNIEQETLFCQVPFNHTNTGTRGEVLVFHLVLEFDCVPPAR